MLSAHLKNLFDIGITLVGGRARSSLGAIRRGPIEARILYIPGLARLGLSFLS